MKEIYNNDMLAENKVLILYIMKNAQKKLSGNDLFKVVSEINGINYFYFSDILGDLIKSELIAPYYKEGNQEILAITDKGEKSLDLTIDILPGIIKFRADNIFEKEIVNIEKEKAITAEYIPENENNFTVKCKITENSKTIFELQTFAGSKDQAKNIADNWNKNADKIYPKIMEILNSFDK